MSFRKIMKNNEGIIDFTRPIEHGMPIYPGEPEVSIEYRQTGQYATVALSLSSHSGTSVDTPKHIIPEGATLDEYPLANWISHGGIVAFRDLQEKDVIEPADLENATAAFRDILPGSFLFIRTGWEAYWGKENYFKHPYLSAASTEWLVKQGVALVGIDAPNIDASWNNEDIAHKTLLENDVLVVENLCNLTGCLSDVHSFVPLQEIFVIPMPLAKSDGAPVRVFASMKKNCDGCVDTEDLVPKKHS
ncbi:cyclase family protein [Brevibacillus fluminis]|uniref:Cyclase family protein n=1 Tax=Brevibacillus fluminis TaxID=511487 RepID=A0A3M8DBQ9_9BACL|nr:cyclase family protein [Brevibacillus fluminis]RNB85464.1 cyclase family protein [Brevibacillus fluminis]